MLNNDNLYNINWKKVNGLIPCIVQDMTSSEILMHGYMNQEALYKTQMEKKVTFYSRTKKRLWTKGETSNNFLNVLNILIDCDKDTLLILVDSINHTCHLNRNSCFHGEKSIFTNFFYLEKFIQEKKILYSKNSYTANLHIKGINRITQKVGEEAIEVIISALNEDNIHFLNEASDLIYHLLVLLHNKNFDFSDVIQNLIMRRIKKK